MFTLQKKFKFMDELNYVYAKAIAEMETIHVYEMEKSDGYCLKDQKE